MNSASVQLPAASVWVFDLYTIAQPAKVKTNPVVDLRFRRSVGWAASTKHFRRGSLMSTGNLRSSEDVPYLPKDWDDRIEYPIVEYFRRYLTASRSSFNIWRQKVESKTSTRKWWHILYRDGKLCMRTLILSAIYNIKNRSSSRQSLLMVQLLWTLYQCSRRVVETMVCSWIGLSTFDDPWTVVINPHQI